MAEWRDVEATSALGKRLRAAELFDRGASRAEIARELGVTRTTAMRWHRKWLAGGRDGLARPGHVGRPRKLSARELSAVLRELPRSWAVERVAAELHARTGVRYHPGHLWRVLAAWGWQLDGRRPARARFADPDGHPLELNSASSRSAADRGRSGPRRA